MTRSSSAPAPAARPAPASRAPRTRGPSLEKTARTRSQIVLAALDVFLERGYARATMADVARTAGLAKGTPYLYFAGKEALFAGVVQEVVVEPLLQAPWPPLETGERLGVFFRRVLLPLMQVVERSRRAAVMRLVMIEGGAFPGLVQIYRREVFDPLVARVRDAAQAALLRGELEAAPIARHPHLLMGPVWVGVANNAVLAPDAPVDIGAMFEAQLAAFFPERRPPT